MSQLCEKIGTKTFAFLDRVENDTTLIAPVRAIAPGREKNTFTELTHELVLQPWMFYLPMRLI